MHLRAATIGTLTPVGFCAKSADGTDAVHLGGDSSWNPPPAAWPGNATEEASRCELVVNLLLTRDSRGDGGSGGDVDNGAGGEGGTAV